MNIKRSRITSIMAFIISILALFASSTGIFNENIYNDLISGGQISKSLVIAAVAQDIISAPLALILFVLSILCLRRPGFKSYIVMMGLAWYFFYAFGLYVIQGLYSSIYLIYLAIFGLSIYSMIWGLLSFEADEEKGWQVSSWLSKSIGGFLIFILIVLIPAWLVRINSDITKHIPGETYSVFIMDLAVVFPAFGQIAYLLFRKRPFGIVLAGVALTKTMTLCLSWSFSHWFLPFYAGLEFETGLTFISTLLTMVSLSLLILYLLKLKRVRFNVN